MPKVSGEKCTPRVFPDVDSLNDLGVTRRDMKAKISGRRYGVLV